MGKQPIRIMIFMHIFYGIILELIKNNKINKMEFNRCCKQIQQTYDLFQRQITASSPINQPHTPSFKQASTFNPKHERQSSGSLSIEDDIKFFITPYPKYKCFKCYGRNQLNSLMRGSAPLCQQCDGSQAISEIHPLASLLNKVMKLKLQKLIPKKDSQPASPCEIDPSVQCNNCEIPLKGQEGYYCDFCIQYVLCSKCYERKIFTHNNGHTFTNKHIKYFLSRLKQNLPTMKKISQEIQAQEGGMCGQDLFCTSCLQNIEECYQICHNCSTQNTPYLMCSLCIQTSEDHKDHLLSMRTVKKQSNFLNLTKQPSESDLKFALTQSLDYEYTRESYDKIPLDRQSIVFIPQMALDESCEMPFESFSPSGSPTRDDNSETQNFDLGYAPSFNPESGGQISSPVLPKQRQRSKSHRKREDSLININMQESLDFTIINNDSGSVSIKTDTMNFNVKDNSFVNATEEDYLFTNYQCDICKFYPIKNYRYHCQICEDYDICKQCFNHRKNDHFHDDYQEIDGKALMLERSKKVINQLQKNSLGRKSIRSSVYH